MVVARMCFSLVLALSLTASARAADPLETLKEGNARFVADAPVHPREDGARRARTASGQQPFAMLLACADSRVAPELVFDQGVGDIFDIRVAGNVAGPDETASIEYAIENLHTPLLVVMGHTSCGAVEAAVERPAGLPVRLLQLIAPIAPAVEQAKADNPGATGKALVAAAIRANVLLQMRNLLRSSDAVRDAVRAGKLQVVGALYDMPTGKVEFVGPHPDQAQLVAEPDGRPGVPAEAPKSAR